MILTIIVFILILGFLVLVHELGHFIIAKKTGMKVQEFGIGFPPTIIKKNYKGTLYCLNAIPLGGYVKIKGEDGANKEDPDSFSAKPVWQRSIVLIAGVSMNIIAGWIIFILLFAFSAPVEITPDIPQKYILSKHIVIDEILENSPAKKAGLKIGDEIISINQIPVFSIDMFQNEVANAQESYVELGIGRHDETINISAEPKMLDQVAENRKVIGVALINVGNARFPIHKAIIAGSKSAYGYLSRIAQSLAGILKGVFYGQGVGSLGGPVAIAVATNDVIDLGFARIMIFTAILSFNLAILNIMPFPALDGGRLIFIAVEAIRRKPSRKEVEEWFHRIGFILFMLFAIFITYKDIMRFGGRIWHSLLG